MNFLRHGRAIAALCCSCLCFAAALPAQQAAAPAPQEPSDDSVTLRVTSRTVEVAAVVRDKAGLGQNGLSKDAFQLRVDGKEQPIQHFSIASDLPLTLVLIVDVSGSQRTFVGDEWRASDIFFQTMLSRPADRAALIQVDARIRTLSSLTNNVSRLHLALTQLGDTPSGASRTLLNDAVFLVSRVMLANEKGRKAIVLLTDGGDNGSRATLDQAIAEAQRADVPVYAVDYTAWVPEGGMGSLAAMGTQSDPGASLLHKVAAGTGGHIYTVTSHQPLHTIFEQIANDLRTQYEIGFAPAADLKPNSFHKLDLRARDKALLVQARSGFFVQP